MTIEYIPPALENALKRGYAKNREGQTSCDICGLLTEGLISEANTVAIEHDLSNPKHKIKVIEQSCGFNVG